ncbi:hypothetical protein F2Q70_00001864 [Brassica cretica]|uniref:Uncharacterized protein n=1 Tax=Brassica cretica TaxID=69181 RepID=A0A8S9IWJ4_BRACR|nr:hypothetical protein F2Q70_00001864 [Brassica cretica]
MSQEQMNYMKVSHMRNFSTCKDNMKAQHRSETAWGRTRYRHPIDRACHPSIDITPSTSIDLVHTTSIDLVHTTSIDIRSKSKNTVREKDKFNNEYLTPDKFVIFRDPDGHARAIDGRILNVSRKDIADILQTANGAENLFVHQHNTPEYQQKDESSMMQLPEFGRRAFDSHSTRKFYWEEKDEYGVYRDEQGYARDLDGKTIRLHNMDIRRVLERASRDEPSYICLPEHANLFTQTKLVPEIYTKDEINEMFYGVYGEQEKNKEAFQMKLDGVYYPLNDSISWLTTCMEEMKQDIARIQHATDVARSQLISIQEATYASRRINDPGIIGACHCGAWYETEYSAWIETHTVTSIDSSHQKSTDTPHEESVNSCPDDWENDYYNPTIAAYTKQHMHTEEYDEDYEDERATEYKTILDDQDTLLYHSSWKRNAPSIDIPGSPSIDTQPPRRNRKRTSTDITNYSSIDAEVNRVREGDYSIGSWADDHHHERYAVETTIYEPGKDELHEGFTYEELLNMQRRDETDQHRSETAWGRTRYTHPIACTHRPSIDINPSPSIDLYPSTSIDIRSKLETTKDIADILQTANGVENLFVHQRNIPKYHQKDTKELYDAAGGIDKSFKLRSHNPTRPSIDVDAPTSVDRQPEFYRRAFDSHCTRKFFWEEKDEYGVYRDEQGYARDLDGNTIRLHNMDIRRVLERAS